MRQRCRECQCGHEERFPLPRRVAAIGSVKGPSPEYPVTTGKRRFRTFPPSTRNGEVRPIAELEVLTHPAERIRVTRLVHERSSNRSLSSGTMALGRLKSLAEQEVSGLHQSVKLSWTTRIGNFTLWQSLNALPKALPYHRRLRSLAIMSRRAQPFLYGSHRPVRLPDLP